MKISTPWGMADVVRFLDPDRRLVKVCTPSHGGIGVCESLPMSSALESLALRDDSRWRWFEEDECWAAAAVAFPEHFPAETVEMAKQTLRDWYPAVYTAHFNEPLTAATSKALAQAEFEAATADKFIVTAGFASGCWNIPKGYVYACGFRKRDECIAGYLVPEDRYVNPSRLVLDEFPRWEPDRTLPYSNPEQGGVAGQRSD